LTNGLIGIALMIDRTSEKVAFSVIKRANTSAFTFLAIELKSVGDSAMFFLITFKNKESNAEYIGDMGLARDNLFSLQRLWAVFCAQR